MKILRATRKILVSLYRRIWQFPILASTETNIGTRANFYFYFFYDRDLKNVKKHGIKQFFVKLFRPLLRYLEKTDENKAITDKLTHDDSQSKLSQEQLSELQRS